ncbi:MAG TPA: hypothetical protein VF656_18975 [Pyrinomonadaceae bacterium]|jgi:hypothetical protein
MAAKLTQSAPPGRDLSNALKSWAMIGLTLVFVLLYGVALFGWLKPSADERTLAHLEPMIFVIVGYYFGRLPAQQNEKTLKDEIGRQTQKADAAQHAKEQSQQVREALEEKLKNVRAALLFATHDPEAKGGAEHLIKTGMPNKDDALRRTTATALSILDS